MSRDAEPLPIAKWHLNSENDGEKSGLLEEYMLIRKSTIVLALHYLPF